MRLANRGQPRLIPKRHLQGGAFLPLKTNIEGVQQVGQEVDDVDPLMLAADADRQVFVRELVAHTSHPQATGGLLFLNPLAGFAVGGLVKAG
jgi:hypothetical protein